MNEWMAAVAVPIAGWALYVERRLSSLMAMKGSVDHIQGRVDKLYEHLIDSSAEAKSVRETSSSADR